MFNFIYHKNSTLLFRFICGDMKSPLQIVESQLQEHVPLIGQKRVF